MQWLLRHHHHHHHHHHCPRLGGLGGGVDAARAPFFPLPSRNVHSLRQPSPCLLSFGSLPPLSTPRCQSKDHLPPPSSSLPPTQLLARFLLFLVPAFWGTYGPSVRFIYAQHRPPIPSVLTLSRKVVSLLFFFCFLPLETSLNRPPELLGTASQETITSKPSEDASISNTHSENFSTANQLPNLLTDAAGVEWTAAIELGLWTFLGTACQTDGLQNTTATRSGFLLQTVTVLVPILTALSGVKVRPITWVAAILALIGVTFMSIQLPDDALTLVSFSRIWSNLGMSKGDMETLFAAFFYALCTVRLGVYAVKAQPVRLSTNLMVVSTILAALWVVSDYVGISSEGYVSEDITKMDMVWLQNPSVLLAISLSALIPGTLASLSQTIGQRTVPASEAQMYFSLQPFWSAVFGAIFLKENMNSSSWAAGALVTVAAFMASYDTLSTEKK